MSAGRGNLFVISAPSGGGKTSLTRAALERLAQLGIPAVKSISCTTRPPRPGERDGEHYHFLSPEAFETRVRAGDFLEHAQVFGHRYGTGRAATEALLSRGTHVALDIDWQGGRQVRAQAAGAVSVFILPPSVEELERRLRTRAQDDDRVIARRMAQAREEMGHYAEYDYLIINRDFEQALAELVDVFHGRGPARAGQAERHKSLIQQLLA